MAAASDDAAMLAVFERLALVAGPLIMGFFNADMKVSEKSDLSPVTEADRQSEELILAGLRQHFPAIPCVAEEEISSGLAPASLGREFFLVDPLDGTREFVNRRPDFTVNIALVRDGAPAIGIVYSPCAGRFYTGRPGHAEVVDLAPDGTIAARRPIAVRRNEGPYTVVASRSHRTPETDDYIAQIEAGEIVSVGSSLKFCLVAAGEADVYPRFGRTMEWDTAAGDAVLRAAGGSVTTVDGAELVYGKRNQPHDADFANPFFIASSGAECFRA